MPPDPAAERYEEGLRLLARGEHFAAHEAFEDVWRTARREERDFFQGLVHVAVAWYQASRRNRVGCERQLEKARRRLGAYRPSHRRLDVDAILAQVESAASRYPELEPLRISRAPESPGPD
jgi:predicted metal-dependent hydrolase